MTVENSSIRASDIDRMASLMIEQSGGTEAILRAVRRARECWSEGADQAARLWEQITAKLRELVPSDKYPENKASPIMHVVLGT